jgi:GH15 family glucan-1,4-alpha-glucosidase
LGACGGYLNCFRILIVIGVAIGIVGFVYKKEGYNKISRTIQSQIVTDQFGYFWTNFTKDQFEVNISDDELAKYNKFWAPNDYIRQSYDEQVFIVYTYFGIKNVSFGECPENPQYDVVICNPKNNTQCISGK